GGGGGGEGEGGAGGRGGRGGDGGVGERLALIQHLDFERWAGFRIGEQDDLERQPLHRTGAFGVRTADPGLGEARIALATRPRLRPESAAGRARRGEALRRARIVRN